MFFDSYGAALNSMSKEEREKFINHEGIENKSTIKRLMDFKLEEKQVGETA